MFKQNLATTLAAGSASFTSLPFRYNPQFSICSNGCQGIFLANGDLSAGTGTIADLGGISAAVGGGQRHIVYGPYITTLQPLPFTAIFKVQVNSISSPSVNVARLEAVDANTGTVIASREIYRSDFHHAYVYSNLTLPFNWVGHTGHQAEFRVYTHDNTYIKVAAVGIYLSSYTFYCPGDLSIATNAHSAGSSCISNSAASNGNLVYGPYLFDFPGKPAVATFSIRASSLTVSGSMPVATIDVHAYNSSGQDQILASANIAANQVDGTYRTFALSYNSKYYTANGWLLETRVSGLGRGLIETQYSFVTPQ